MTRFIHTADWHLGKPFSRIENPARREELRRARFSAVAGLAARVAEQRAALVLVAGDLFDGNSVATPALIQGLAAMGELGVPVIAIPGNHDHGGQGSVYLRPDFERRRAQYAPNLRVVLEPGVLEVEGLRILACPLQRRQVTADPTTWTREVLAAAEPMAEPMAEPTAEPIADPIAATMVDPRPAVVLAHGTVLDFGRLSNADPEAERGTPNLIDVKMLERAGADYVALGDWHGQTQVSDRSWYSGTPEPTGFGTETGRALLVEVTAHGQPPAIVPLATGQIGWHERSIDVFAEEALAHLRDIEHQLAGRPGAHLLRLTVTGLLGLEGRARLDERIEELRHLTMSLELDDQVRLRPSNEELAQLTRRGGLLGGAARKLAARTAGGGDDAEVATLALLKLYQSVVEHERENVPP